jgi:hypothetical protein
MKFCNYLPCIVHLLEHRHDLKFVRNSATKVGGDFFLLLSALHSTGDYRMLESGIGVERPALVGCSGTSCYIGIILGT